MDPGPRTQALGRSRGLTTKIHMLADVLGRPPRFFAPALPESREADAVFTDKAYDSNGLREIIAKMDAQAVIPSRRDRRAFIPHDPELYKQRNRIERCFSRLKHFRRFRNTP